MFSVIIPVFNRDPTKALKSVQAQIYRDFECLVIDDGSANGAEIASAVQRLGDPRFRYVHRENGGAGAARNTGIDQAKEAFVAFLDSDDEWLPEKLARDSERARQSTVLFSPVIVARNGRLVGHRPSRGPRPGEDISEYLLCRQGFMQTSTIVLHRVGAQQVRFTEGLKFGDDTDFVLRLAAVGARFRMHRTPLVIMRDDETGDRKSRSDDYRATLGWLESVRPIITKRAYRSCKGWHVARQAAQSGEVVAGMALFLRGLGSFSLPLTLKAFGQVVLPRSLYRRLQGLLAAARL